MNRDGDIFHPETLRMAMKKLTLILTMWIMIMTCCIFGVTHTVAIDGSQQYTSIQTAIDNSSNGDIVLVYPGEYFEALNTNGRSISIQSTYPLTQSEETIDNTIIHASVPFSCLEVKWGETVTINGFTMMNNYPLNLAVNTQSPDGLFGGGVEVYNLASIQILNCVIKNCIAQGSGGVYFGGVDFFMSNTKIFDNYGIEVAGGITIEGANLNLVTFDSIYPNSIYNNTSRGGMDILFIEYANPIHIILHTFSTILTEPDNFFFKDLRNAGITITVQNAYFNLINHDLYVAPNGNNANTGITPDSPLQTIAYAVKLIQPDSLNPKTIHLAPGVYNFTDSNQYYPFTIKAHTRLVGDDMDTTILDNGQTLRNYFGFYKQDDIHIEKISFSPYISHDNPFGFSNSENIVLRNLKFDGTFGDDRIKMSYNNDVVCENIIIGNSYIHNDDNLGFLMSYCNNVIMNNVIIDNMDSSGLDGNAIGIECWESDVTIRNSIISNCDTYDASMFMYQTIGEDQNSYNLDMSNLLFINNNTENEYWGRAPMYIQNRFQAMKINNCTFANNHGAGFKVIYVFGDCDISNSIFYNPGNSCDLAFRNVFDVYSFYPSISYSLLNSPYSATDSSQVSINSVFVNENPLFLGANNPDYDISMPEYYKLSSRSPCIDAGTRDTLGMNIPPMDLAGNYRIWDNCIDMGCFEYGSAPVANDNPEYPALPDRIVLSTYPNPVYLNGSKGAFTFIEFTLPEKAIDKPVVEIYNLKGQKVRTMRVGESFGSMARKAGLNNYELKIMEYELACNTGTLACERKLISTRHVPTNKIETDNSVCSTTTGKDACVTKNGTFYSTVWDCRDEHSQKLASGIYIVKVTSGRHQTSGKMTILK